jgi:Glu-tRNA(Gln) amidotransferase subunit E-like FAD-binding protein
MAKANLMDYEKALELFEVVIGLEVHVELNTNTKIQNVVCIVFTFISVVFLEFRWKIEFQMKL